MQSSRRRTPPPECDEVRPDERAFRERARRPSEGCVPRTKRELMRRATCQPSGASPGHSSLSPGAGLLLRRAVRLASKDGLVESLTMDARDAACSCGQLRVEAGGDPIRISICHCLACQRRTGSVFAAQARFSAAQVRVIGRFSNYVRVADESGEERTFHFCPECGATVFYTCSEAPEVIAVPVGAFADPSFPPPTVSVFESRRHPWVIPPEAVEHQQH